MTFYSFMPRLLNMTLTASVVICAVLVLRLFLKKAPKAISYVLWSFVLFRLFCPFSFQSSLSAFSLIGIPTSSYGVNTSIMEYIPENIVHTEYPAVSIPVPVLSEIINETLPQGNEQLAADPLEGQLFIAACVWVLGIAGMLGYSLCTYIRLRRKLQIVMPLRDNIFIADDIVSPFVIGLLRPKIYLPCNLNETEQEYIILHEQFHIKRFDYIFKAIAFFALTVHWFNPLVWLAFVLSSKDMEMSCDEAVIGKLGSDMRADYSASLLALATGRRIIAGTPLAFGEGDTADRIKNLSKWKKPTWWIVIVAVMFCIAAAVCFLTNPKNNEPDLSFLNYENACSHVADVTDVDTVYYPTTGKNEDGKICIGYVNGNELAKYLDLVSWQKCKTPQYGLSSPGSIEFCIRDDYRITVYQKPHRAMVTYQSEVRYYKTHSRDYDNAVKLFYKEPQNFTAAKWFDGLNGNDSVWGTMRQTSLDEFPGAVFQWHPEGIEAVTDTSVTTLYNGMPIWSIYFCDLNGDGKREICSTVSSASDVADNRIIVADYANGIVHEMSDPGFYDYSLIIRDSRLWVEKRAYARTELIESGPLVLRSVIENDGTAFPMLMFE